MYVNLHTKLLSEIRFLPLNLQRNFYPKAKKMKNKKEQKELLTRKETAELLQIDLSTLWDYTRKKMLPAYGIGKRVYYKYSEVIEALIKIN